MFKRLINLIGLGSTMLTIVAIYLCWRSGTQQDAMISGHAAGSLVLIASRDHELKVEIYSAWPCEQPWERKSLGLGDGFVAGSAASLSQWSFAGVRETKSVQRLELDDSGKPRWGYGSGSHLSLWMPPLSSPINLAGFLTRCASSGTA